MKKLISIIFFIGYLPVNGQVDSKINDYVNHCFNDLPSSQQIDSLGNRWNLDFCNIASLMVVEALPLNESDLNLMSQRSDELADRFYREGSPLILLYGGMNNSFEAKELNKAKSDSITYVSLGNTCLTNGIVDKLISRFNKKTLALMEKDLREK